MSKKAKTTIICDVCHKPIVEGVNTDIPWFCMLSAEKKQYFQVGRAISDGNLYDCCSMECVMKKLENRINDDVNMLVKQQVIYYEK